MGVSKQLNPSNEKYAEDNNKMRFGSGEQSVLRNRVEIMLQMARQNEEAKRTFH